MGYSIYERKNFRTSSPAVTVTSQGRIALNSPLSKLFHKMAVQSVLLMWDDEKRKVALRPITKKDNRSYSVAYSHDVAGASVSAHGFLKHLGWDGKKHNVPAIWNDDESVLEFDIPQWGKHSKQKVVAVETGRKQKAV